MLFDILQHLNASLLFWATAQQEVEAEAEVAFWATAQQEAEALCCVLQEGKAALGLQFVAAGGAAPIGADNKGK